MRVILKRAQKPPEVSDVQNTLEALQSIVGGPIQVVQLTPDTVLICNEEGKIHNLPVNFWAKDEYIAGDVLFCGTYYGDFTDIPDQDAQMIWLYLNGKVFQ